MKRLMNKWWLPTLLLFIVAGGYEGYRKYNYHKKLELLRLAHRPPLPFTYNVTVCDSNEKGYLLLAPYKPLVKNEGKLMIMDMQGNIVFEKRIDQTIYGFRQWKIGKNVYYTYMVDDTTAYHINKIHLYAGHAVICDTGLNVIKTVHLIPHDDITTNRHEDLDPHDFILLDTNHYITCACYEKHVDNIPDSLHPCKNVKVGAIIIQEIKDGKLVFHWDATKFPEFYGVSTEKNNFADSSVTHDFMHVNSMFIDPKDNNLIVSFRCLNQFIKIDRKDGHIIWRLGGKNSDFPLTDDQYFYRMHHVTLVDSGKTYMMLDNGDTIKRRSSRFMEMQIDETNRKILSHRYTVDPDTQAWFMGSVFKENDDYLVAGGSGKFVLKLDKNTRKKKFEMFLSQLNYRAYKVDSLYGLEKHFTKSSKANNVFVGGKP